MYLITPLTKGLDRPPLELMLPEPRIERPRVLFGVRSMIADGDTLSTFQCRYCVPVGAAALGQNDIGELAREFGSGLP
jgi:hypothetical protein